MKILHLADLHLGKLLYGVSLVENGDQKYLVNQILNSLSEEQPDAVVIAGDVYDRGIPSKEAVELFDYCLTEMVKLVKAILIIPGNHDSGERLAFASEMLQKQGIHIAGKVKGKMDCVTLEDEYGPVHFWLMPYLFPASVQVALENKEETEGNEEETKDNKEETEGNGEEAGENEEKAKEGESGSDRPDESKDRYGSYDSAVRTYLEAQNINYSERNVLVAHQLVTNRGEEPQRSGSETLVGGVGHIDASAFEDFDYVALGHIHGAQSVGKSHIRYAGAPLCYHFDEIRQKKGFLYIELSEKGKGLSLKTKEMSVLHPLRQIEGRFDDIVMTEMVNGKEQEYLRVILQDEQLPPDARMKLKSLFEGKGSILMDLSRTVNTGHAASAVENASKQKEKTIEELFYDFYSIRTEGELPNQTEQKLIKFVAEKTIEHVNAGEKQGNSTEQDVMDLVEFCLKQEEA